MSDQIPVLKIGPVLMVSIQTELHDRLAQEMQESILNKIYETGAPAVLIDITSLEMVDSFIGRVLAETARMARLMNTRVVMVGMQPVVAMTLLEMGLEIPEIHTAIDLESGLKKLGYELRSIDPHGESAGTKAENDIAEQKDAHPEPSQGGSHGDF